MNDLYIARKISELPKEDGWYFVLVSSCIPDSAYFSKIQKAWNSQQSITHWLEKTTLENLLSENPQAVEKIFEAFIEDLKYDPYPTDIFPPVTKGQLKDIHLMLEENFNMPLDRLSAEIGRQLRKGLLDKFEPTQKQVQ